MSSYHDIEIDKKKFNRMCHKIYGLETENSKKRKLTHRQMVDKIHKIMINELRKTM